MRTLLLIVAEAARRLAGPGAVVNAAHEVDHANRSVAELDEQLRRVPRPAPIRAA
jgi:hypothetical protein